jgi:hypothetical protein
MPVVRLRHLPPRHTPRRSPLRRRGTLKFPSREARGLGRGSRAAISLHVKTFLAILVGLLMFATLGVLFAGLFGLVRGGGDPARSNQLMRWRVILQGAALLLFALLMTLLRS